MQLHSAVLTTVRLTRPLETWLNISHHVQAEIEEGKKELTIFKKIREYCHKSTPWAYKKGSFTNNPLSKAARNTATKPMSNTQPSGAKCTQQSLLYSLRAERYTQPKQRPTLSQAIDKVLLWYTKLTRMVYYSWKKMQVQWWPSRAMSQCTHSEVQG